MPGRPHAPVGKLELDDADGVLGHLLRAARLLADAGVNGLQALGPQHTLLDLGQQAVLLVEREVAARMHDHLAIVGLDIGEELDAAAELAVADLHHDQQQRGQRQRHARTAQRKADGPHVEPVRLRTLVMRMRRSAAEQRAKRWREEQRHRERRR